MRGLLRSLAVAILFPLLLPEGWGQELVPISVIQSSQASSPFTGQFLSVDTAVVTARGGGFFMIQSRVGYEDADSTTSEALWISNETGVGVSIGQLVRVDGIVREMDGQTSLTGPNLQILPLAASEALPPPRVLTGAFPSPNLQAVPDLERIEGMRIQVAATVAGPSSDFGTAYLVAGSQRPFREPGIEWPGLPNLPVWDGNPELFRFNPDGLQAPDNRFLNAGGRVNATGVLVQDGSYFLLPTAYTTDIPDPRRPVRPATPIEITVASLNALRLGPDFDDYGPRLAKIARYIAEQLRFPDVIALQEIGGVSVLEALGFRLEQLRPDLSYQTFYLSGSGDIHTGFLVREGLGSANVRQLGKEESLSTGGRLFSRPPLLLELQLANADQTKLKIMNLHLRSLIGIEGSDATYVRQLRYEQSLSVAQMVNALEEENLLLVGDFNAFAFSDGYVDVVNQIAGRPSLGALLPWQPTVAEPLRILTQELPVDERYSYIFRGSSQLLDHALLSEDLQGIGSSELQFARGNADAAEAYFSNPNLSTRAGDHDGFVVYLALDEPLSYRNQLVDGQLRFLGPNPAWSGSTLRFEHAFPYLDYTWFDVRGKKLLRGRLNNELVVPRFSAAGNYFLRLRTPGGRERTFSLILL